MANRTAKTEQTLPLLPLRGMLVFPHMLIHLEVGREKSIRAVEQAMETAERLLVVSAQKDVKIDEPGADDINEIGCLVEVKQLIQLPGGTVRILVEGLVRARIIRFTEREDYMAVEYRPIEVAEDITPRVAALMRTIVQQFESYVKFGKRLPAESVINVVNIEEPGKLADVIAGQLVLKVEEKYLQSVLEAFPLLLRLESLAEILGRELEVLDLERRINNRVRKQMEKTQKEYYLREQMKAISKELGEGDDKLSEIEEFRQKVKELELPPDAAEKANREISRLEKMPPAVAEAVVVRNYLEWLLDLPWNKETEDLLDVVRAEQILHEDHYGLEKVKERILEYLATRQLTRKLKGPIVCLVGPPGVGKTSLAKSVARALDRKFVRVSLGGMRDEAEIRGHRRTYVGALPGRIIQGLRQAGTKNPVFLLDEIDKLTADFRGDPASALLEALDPEQNHSFSDHFIEVPFDLSKVLFITTANNAGRIPWPLLDRMELISLSGYTEEEKVEIAVRHLMPKLLSDHGLDPANLDVSGNAIRHIIREYTREAGVRNLERELARICRKTAREVVGGRDKTVRVSVSNLQTFLGVPRYRYGVAEHEHQVGVAMAMAATEVGGDVMPIEVTVMKGKGQLLLTGQLGEVMKESAQAGFSYIRSRTQMLGIEEDFHEKYDIHVHVPEAALPKEGPSAGVTMATAIISALSGRPVRSNVAMTGEITLRGRVLPIGGVKEKVLAAHRAGIDIVLLPAENRKDAEEDLPVTIRKRLEIIYVDHLDQVLEAALVQGGDFMANHLLATMDLPAGEQVTSRVPQ